MRAIAISGASVNDSHQWRSYPRRQQLLVRFAASTSSSFKRIPVSTNNLACALSRLFFASDDFLQLHFPSALPSAWFSCPHLSRLAPLRYYGASDSYDRRTSHRSLRLLRLAIQASRPQPRHAPERRFISRLSAFGFLGFAMNEQARHATPPNQVRHPTGYSFASGYSPPRLATTQLPSATLLRFTMTRTCTVPTKRPHGRTHPDEDRDPSSTT